MRRLASLVSASCLVAAVVLPTAAPALADSGKPGQSMTHITTVEGMAPALEKTGVILYTKGGATSAVVGDSIAAPTSQVVFHVPITSSKGTVKHLGSVLALFNTTSDKQVELRNPVIDLKAGVVRAGVGAGPVATVFTITNAKALKPKVTKDPATGNRVTAYSGARLAFAPGIADVVVSALGLPAGSLADGAQFATADVTLHSTP
jgi:hypothetical protein